jgi:uncharacterized membrane protein YfcA
VSGVIVALVAAGVLIGLTLGVLGAGGSILAVPVLVHVAGLSATAATATSLVAVGAAAALGAWGHRRNARADVALWFVPPGLAGAVAGAAAGTHLDDEVLLLGFSVLMAVAAWRMLAARPAPPRALSAATHHPAHRVGSRASRTAPATTLGTVTAVVVSGGVVGFLTGLFGVGGGFVIVPALTLAVGLAMPQAIATSLLIIAFNAVIALGVRGADAVDWPFALALTVPMLIGSLAGAGWAQRLEAGHVRRAFAALLVVVALVNVVTIVP